MNAINHSITALVIKKYSPSTPLLPILISVQLIEVLWVVLNIIGVEHTDFEPTVSSLADVHLEFAPYSHSIAFTILWAALAWWVVAAIFKKPAWGPAIAIGVMSHIVLDIITHSPDVEIIPFLGWPEIGSGLYGIPVYALVLELAYAVLCWWLVKGSGLLLAGILVLNLFGVTFYLPQIQGLETLLASYPYFFAPVIGVHILLGWGAIYYLGKREQTLQPVTP